MALARPILLAGILAGLIAGALATLVQGAKLAPLIAAAERFEAGQGAAHPHDDGAAAHDHAPVARGALTLVANLVVGAGFGLMMAGGFALRRVRTGAPPDLATGVLWGMAGFAAFAAAPALGLPPELPGSAEAGLAARQAWWLATAVATLSGLGALAYGGALWQRSAGVGLLVVPHLLGAPMSSADAGSTVPAELAARFAAASLVTAALFWVALGCANAWLYRRLSSG